MPHNQEFFPVGDRVSIFLRGKTWYVNFQLNGRQHRKSLATRNKKEAVLRAQRVEADLDRGAVEEQIKISSIEDVVAAFVLAAEVQPKADKTITKYRKETSRIREFADSRGQSSMAHLNAEFADAYRAMLQKIPLDPITVYASLIILRSLVLFALRRRMTDADTLVGYPLKKPKPRRQPCWSPAEADRIVAAAPDVYRPYFTFLRETGCRAGEAKFLTWADVDWAQQVVHVRAKEGWRPKSGDERSIPMTDKLLQMLRTLPHASRWVFTARVTARYPEVGRQISERRALEAIKRVLKKLKLVGKLHTFRHTFISQALTKGVPEVVVRQWVGHVDPDVIRAYTHVSDSISKQYLDRFSCEPESKPKKSELDIDPGATA